MHSVRSPRRLAPPGAVLFISALLTTGPAHAETGFGGSRGEADASSDSSGRTITSQVTFNTSKNGTGESTGALTAVGDYDPPACWYEPKWTPEEYEKEFKRRWNVGHFSGAAQGYAAEKSRYVEGKPYKDFNKEKSGEGMFWGTVYDWDRLEGDDYLACSQADFWVDNGDDPPVEGAIDTETLAKLAYNQLQVPDTEVTLAPEEATKVNLPTASLNVGGWNLSATTTAKPVSLKLEPGTADATVIPASGECTIGADGSVGEPYAKGKSDKTPPCGVTYLRSSGEGTYDLKATVTWEIAWEGSNGEAGTLPDGTFGNDQAVTVQEIQAVNR
jgi:enoyl reductase